MSLQLLCFVIFSGCTFIYRVSNAQMILQSCIKDISVLNLGGAAYPSGNNEFYVTIAVDSETPINTTLTTLTTGSAAMSDEICFDFDTSTTTTIVSFLPIRGRLITFNILGDGDAFGRAKSLFPNPSLGSNKTAFVTDTLSIQPTSTFDGTITFSLYHQMKTSSIYLKIANRNFNVYRQCFAMKRLCLYRGGVENPIYPNDCINSTILQAANIQIYPDDGGGIANLLDTDDGTLWTSTPTPTATLPKGDSADSRKCWAPFSQYIIIDLSDISSTVPAISSISLGFTADPSLEHSGDTTGSPPRWLTFAFDSNPTDLNSTTSDIDTDQLWAVDLRGGNFLSEGASGIYQYVWTVNPLFFQLDSKPGPNKFRMTQITKGFGLQYLESTQLQYRTPGPVPAPTWNTYAAAYIKESNVNTFGGGPYPNQVDELAEVACKDIFPSPSPTHISIAYQSNTYNACWDYSPDRTHECYDHSVDPLNPGGVLFYPPAAYILDSPCCDLAVSTAPYCVDEPHTDPLSAVTHWGLCPAEEYGEMFRCMLVPDPCNRATNSFAAIPMGWICAVPTTPEPTTIPTRSPITAQPTYNPTFHPTLHPTFIPTFYPTNNPTFYPTFYPTTHPTFYPTINPTNVPTYNPTTPSSPPTFIPTINPTNIPTFNPSQYPTNDPTADPTTEPSQHPTINPTQQPSDTPTPSPTGEGAADTPTEAPNTTHKKEDTHTFFGDTDSLFWWLLIASITALCCCFIGLAYLFKRKYKEPENEEEVKESSLADVVAETHILPVPATDGQTSTIEMNTVKRAEKSESSSDPDIDEIFHGQLDSEDGSDIDMYTKGDRKLTNQSTTQTDVYTVPMAKGDSANEGDGQKGVLSVGNRQVSAEGGDRHRGGDPAVTGGNFGDPVVTKDNATQGLSAMHEMSSSEDDDNELGHGDGGLYAKGRGVSKGGPKKNRKKAGSYSYSDSDGGKGKGKVEIVYGDPVVTRKGNEDNDTSEEDEFDDDEQYQI